MCLAQEKAEKATSEKAMHEGKLSEEEESMEERELSVSNLSIHVAAWKRPSSRLVLNVENSGMLISSNSSSVYWKRNSAVI